jgi:hypothetical protein
MIRTISIIAFAWLAVGCAAVDNDDTRKPTFVERGYLTGSMIPRDRGARLPVNVLYVDQEAIERAGGLRIPSPLPPDPR